MVKQGRRLNSLIRRTIKELELVVTSLLFSLKYFDKNNFGDLFRFRKAVEIEHVSPFRNFFNQNNSKRHVRLNLPQFGNASMDFDLIDPFQMAICEEFIKYKIYNLDLLRFTPDFSVDCGTYRGYFTFLMNSKFRELKKICIEPHPENFKYLLQTAKENGIDLLAVYNNALSKKCGTVSLELWGSNLSKQDNVQASSCMVEIPAIDLKEVLNDIQVDDKLVLKMDIEGSELDFFPECIDTLPKVCAVYLETHDGWDSLDKIKQTFLEYGFTFSVLRERSLYIDSFAQRR